MARNISVTEILQHQTVQDVWTVVNGDVFDLTAFAPEHPGGSEIIYKYAGRDSSAEYNQVHSPSLIKRSLPSECHVGSLDQTTVTPEWEGINAVPATRVAAATIPSLDDIITIDDFAKAAQRALAEKPWAFIKGGSADNATRDANASFLRKIWLRPRIMRKVGRTNTRTRLFGCNLDIPIFISPTGGSRMGGAEGELTLARGAAASGIVHCFATPSSYPHQEILNETREHAFFQLYVNKDRKQSEKALKEALASGKVRAVLMTVDVPVIPMRDDDERVKTTQAVDLRGVKKSGDNHTGKRDKRGAGTARLASSFIDPNVTWSYIKWLRGVVGHTPVVIKGIQHASDALLAMEMGCDGIVISNHGGRAQDYSQPAILTLLEINKNCPQVLRNMEVLIDGGFRRGSDVVKAICLGASAVGLGRPFLYALGYGQEGVEHAVGLIKHEIESTMSLCGMTDLMRDAHPDYVNTSELDSMIQGPTHPYARKVTRVQCRL